MYFGSKRLKGGEGGKLVAVISGNASGHLTEFFTILLECLNREIRRRTSSMEIFSIWTGDHLSHRVRRGLGFLQILPQQAVCPGFYFDRRLRFCFYWNPFCELPFVT